MKKKSQFEKTFDAVKADLDNENVRVIEVPGGFWAGPKVLLGALVKKSIPGCVVTTADARCAVTREQKLFSAHLKAKINQKGEVRISPTKRFLKADYIYIDRGEELTTLDFEGIDKLLKLNPKVKILFNSDYAAGGACFGWSYSEEKEEYSMRRLGGYNYRFSSSYNTRREDGSLKEYQLSEVRFFHEGMTSEENATEHCTQLENLRNKKNLDDVVSYIESKRRSNLTEELHGGPLLFDSAGSYKSYQRLPAYDFTHSRKLRESEKEYQVTGILEGKFPTSSGGLPAPKTLDIACGDRFLLAAEMYDLRAGQQVRVVDIELGKYKKPETIIVSTGSSTNEYHFSLKRFTWKFRGGEGADGYAEGGRYQQFPLIPIQKLSVPNLSKLRISRAHIDARIFTHGLLYRAMSLTLNNFSVDEWVWEQSKYSRNGPPPLSLHKLLELVVTPDNFFDEHVIRFESDEPSTET